MKMRVVMMTSLLCTRSMVYKGMVYKGQNISSTEDFWKNKDIH